MSETLEPIYFRDLVKSESITVYSTRLYRVRSLREADGKSFRNAAVTHMLKRVEYETVDMLRRLGVHI